MPELDFAGLRQDAETAFRPQFEVVRRRYRQRRRRRAGIAAVGVACLVAAGGALVAQIGPGGGASPGAAGGTIDDKWGVLAGDLDHLYAPYQRCDPRGYCSGPELLVSADQGHTWHPGAQPTVPDGWAMMAVRTLGPQTLVITGFTAPKYLVSTDGGSSWRVAEPGPSVATVPDGWRPLSLEPVIGKGGGVPSDYTLIVGDPVTGALAPLTSHLRIGVAALADSVPDATGLWASGSAVDPDTGRQVVATSQDRGATWQSAPIGPAGPVDLRILGYAHGTVYAALHSRSGGPVQLYASTDKGLTWQTVTMTTPAPANANLLYGLVLDDGRILVPGALAQGPGDPTPTSGKRGLFVSADGGKTFQPTDKLPGAYAFGRITGGYIALLPGTGVWLSRDGTTWVQVNKPSI
jgi:hypothetical protein